MSPPVTSLDVLLLTQPTCGHCDETRALLDRLAAVYPLMIAEIELSSAVGQALAQRHGLLFAPAIMLDGEAFAYGHIGERALRREIERRLTGAPDDLAAAGTTDRQHRGHTVLRWLARRR